MSKQPSSPDIVNRNMRFGRRGVIVCISCGKHTRETGYGESQYEMCRDCIEDDEYNNLIADGQIAEAEKFKKTMRNPPREGDESCQESTTCANAGVDGWERKCMKTSVFRVGNSPKMVSRYMFRTLRTRGTVSSGCIARILHVQHASCVSWQK